MDEHTVAIQRELAEWREQCEVWAKAYHRASQTTLTQNSRLVVLAILTAAITTALSGIAPQPGLEFLSYIAAGVGVVTATVTGLQKTTFASPDRSKELHNAAVGYGQLARHIGSVLVLGFGINKDELIKKRDELKTQY